MRARKLIPIAFALMIGLSLVRLANGLIQNNLANIIAANAFSGRFATSRSIELWRVALSLNCSGERICGLKATDSGKAIIEMAREQFIPDATPMQVVSNSLRITNDQFIPLGFPDSLQGVDTPGVMYGPGRLKSRLFLWAEQENCWQIAVKAKHDDPPPVNLEVWLDEVLAGVLSFDRGDQSWEVLSVNTPATPNTHILSISFTNDYLDEESGADRNAYIEYVEVTRIEDSLCDND